MGAYLSQPVTAKDSSDGASDAYAYGTTAMQGWRTNMEVGDDARGVLFFLTRDARATDDDDEPTERRGIWRRHSGTSSQHALLGFARID